MASKHTKAPWTLGPDGMDIIGDGSPVCHLGQYGEIKPWKRCKNIEANARLIAAAPDLLAACEESLPWVATAMAHRRDKRPEFDAHPDAVKNHERALAMLMAAVKKAKAEATHA